MAWLGENRVRGYLRLFAVLNVASLVWLVASSHHGVDVWGHLLGSDFLSFWTAGHMLHVSAPVYDMAAHIASQRQYFAPAGGFTAFFYPPTFLPICWMLGGLSYFPALATWLAVTGAFYFAAVRAWAKHGGLHVPVWLLIAAFPAVPIVITHGQTSFLVAACLGLGMLLVARNPVAAGLLFAVATIKPQFGLMVPLVLVLTDQWRVVMAASLGALVLAFGSMLAFGTQVWPDWLAVSAQAQSAMAGGAVGYAKMTSPFAAIMLGGGTLWAAYAVQGAITLTLAAILAFAAWRRGWSDALSGATLAAAPLATPFVLDYDLVLLGFPLLWLAAQHFRKWDKAIVALGFVAPAIARPLAMHVHVQIMPLVLALVLAALFRRIFRPDPQILETPAASGHC